MGPDKTVASETPRGDKSVEEKIRKISITHVRMTDGHIILDFGAVTVRALIDTGSTLSLLRQSFLSAVEPDWRDRLKSCELSELSTAGKSSLKVIGTIAYEIEKDGRTYPLLFYVAPELTQEALLGKDFLDSVDAVIETSRDRLWFRTQEIDIKEILEIPPVSEVVVPFDVEENSFPEGVSRSCSHQKLFLVRNI